MKKSFRGPASKVVGRIPPKWPQVLHIIAIGQGYIPTLVGVEDAYLPSVHRSRRFQRALKPATDTVASTYPSGRRRQQPARGSAKRQVGVGCPRRRPACGRPASGVCGSSAGRAPGSLAPDLPQRAVVGHCPWGVGCTSRPTATSSTKPLRTAQTTSSCFVRMASLSCMR